MPVKDYRSLLRQAIAEARDCGLGAEADQLEQAVSSAFTTSSEVIAEQGEAVMRFTKATRGRMRAGVKANLDRCLAEIGKTRPVYRRFSVWAYRKFFV